MQVKLQVVGCGLCEDEKKSKGKTCLPSSVSKFQAHTSLCRHAEKDVIGQDAQAGGPGALLAGGWSLAQALGTPHGLEYLHSLLVPMPAYCSFLSSELYSFGSEGLQFAPYSFSLESVSLTHLSYIP